MRNKLTESAIYNALGNNRKFSKISKETFSKALFKELQNILAAAEIAFPDKKTVKDLIKKLEKISAVAKELSELSETHPFARSLLSLASRKITEKDYNYLDLLDIEAFSNISIEWSKHVRFFNRQSGPDSRLALTIATVTAEYYRRILALKPGISGEGEGANGEPLTTPYQRVCNIIAKAQGITIGRPILGEAIRLSSNKDVKYPYFKAGVHNLIRKKLN